MKITELKVGKHYLLDEPEGNPAQTEVYLESYRWSVVGKIYLLHFVKDDETLDIYPAMANEMVFHEISEVSEVKIVYVDTSHGKPITTISGT